MRRERKRNRLKNFNYSQAGGYFVTICSKNRENYFGGIRNGVMGLNKCGCQVRKQCLWLGKQYQYVYLDEFIIMPNHLHGILFIKDNYFIADRRDKSQNGCDRRVKSRLDPTGNDDNSIPADKIKSLPELIGAFKTTSSKLLHQDGFSNFTWQRSFYDHIIRNEKSLNNIREYIRNNPRNWKNDRNNAKDD